MRIRVKVRVRIGIIGVDDGGIGRHQTCDKIDDGGDGGDDDGGDDDDVDGRVVMVMVGRIGPFYPITLPPSNSRV